MRLCLGLLFLATSFSILGCNPNRLEAVPTKLIGEWVTSEERYRDLIIEITDKSLLFKDTNNNNPTEIFPISKIEQDDKEDSLYTIFYETKDDLEYQFAIYYEKSEEGILRLKNQKRYMWKKIIKEEGS